MTNKTPHSLCIDVSVDGIKACLSTCERLADKVSPGSVDELTKFETKDLPLVCGICETAITESNPHVEYRRCLTNFLEKKQC